MDKVALVGSIAAILTTASFLPQALKVYRTRKAGDLSLPMYAMLLSGIILWAVYGFLINSPPIILANSITSIFCVYILAMKIKYG